MLWCGVVWCVVSFVNKCMETNNFCLFSETFSRCFIFAHHPTPPTTTLNYHPTPPTTTKLLTYPPPNSHENDVNVIIEMSSPTI